MSTLTIFAHLAAVSNRRPYVAPRTPEWKCGICPADLSLEMDQDIGEPFRICRSCYPASPLPNLLADPVFILETELCNVISQLAKGMPPRQHAELKTIKGNLEREIKQELSLDPRTTHHAGRN